MSDFEELKPCLCGELPKEHIWCDVVGGTPQNPELKQRDAPYCFICENPDCGSLLGTSDCATRKEAVLEWNNCVLSNEKLCLQSQLFAVTSERDKYRDMVNEGTRDIMLNEFNMRGAHFEIELHHPVFSVVAIQAAQYLTEKKADNYVEMKVWTKEHGDVTITVQKCKGKTPHEIRKEAEQERDALLKITDVPEGQGSAFYSCDKCGNYLPRVSALEHQLKSAKAELAEANAYAETLATSRDGNDGKLYCRHCDGWGYDFEGEINVDHKQDCPVKSYRARLAKDES